MARVTFTVKAAPTAYPAPQGGGTPVDQSQPSYSTLNKGALTGIGALVTTDLNAAGVSSTLVANTMGTVVTQIGSVITAIDTGTGSAAAAALLSLAETGTTDVASVLA